MTHITQAELSELEARACSGRQELVALRAEVCKALMDVDIMPSWGGGNMDLGLAVRQDGGREAGGRVTESMGNEGKGHPGA